MTKVAAADDDVSIFIDFEAFPGTTVAAYEGDIDERMKNAAFNIKELCVMSASDIFHPIYYIFRPTQPYAEIHSSDKKTVKWLSTHYHQLEWEEGVSKFCRICVMRTIMRRFPNYEQVVFYVTGDSAQKLAFLQQTFPKFNFTLSNMALSTLPLVPWKFNLSCPYRAHGQHCAYLKCVRMAMQYLTLRQRNANEHGNEHDDDDDDNCGAVSW